MNIVHNKCGGCVIFKLISVPAWHIRCSQEGLLTKICSYYKLIRAKMFCSFHEDVHIWLNFRLRLLSGTTMNISRDNFTSFLRKSSYLYVRSVLLMYVSCITYSSIISAIFEQNISSPNGIISFPTIWHNFFFLNTQFFYPHSIFTVCEQKVYFRTDCGAGATTTTVMYVIVELILDYFTDTKTQHWKGRVNVFRTNQFVFINPSYSILLISKQKSETASVLDDSAT